MAMLGLSSKKLEWWG